MKYILKSLIMVAGISLVATSCRKTETPKVTDPPVDVTAKEVHINFKNVVGSQALMLNTATYTTPENESITISKFSYYITNIKLTATDGSVYTEEESYHLAEQDRPASLHFHLANVPARTYKSITFLIGVDEARNTSGAQTGALDPINGMFWTWNSGYIMAKLEGTSPQSTESTNKYVYHIGGFKGENSGVRSVTLDFPNTIDVGGKKNGDLVINADLMKWFAPNTLKIADDNEIMNVSAQSKAIADNYAKMFTLVSAVSVEE